MKLAFKNRSKIRPTAGYSYYHADRHLRHAQTGPKTKLKWEVWAVALMLLVVGLFLQFHGNKQDKQVSSTQPKTTISKKKVAAKPTTKVATPATTPAPSKCSGNTLPKFVLVSVSQRHLWACEGATQVHDSPVITGMEKLAADLTPRGTFKVYGKVTDTVLKGSDSTGSWNDPVSYWMPYLDNQYGTYGFHDATWRNPNEFGNVDPNSDNGSHGCVEMPLNDMAWLYNWAPVGTTLTVVD